MKKDDGEIKVVGENRIPDGEVVTLKEYPTISVPANTRIE